MIKKRVDLFKSNYYRADIFYKATFMELYLAL